MSQGLPILGAFGPDEVPKLPPAELPIGKLEANYPPVVIEGLLRQSEIILMGGQAKKWKSWARADMLYCIGNGFQWLKFPCHQGLVVHFDLELLQADLRWRFEVIHQSYCKEGFKGTLDNLRFVPLRGVPFTMSNFEQWTERFDPEKPPVYCVASIDPIYRLLAGKSESDPVAVTELLTRFLNIGVKIKTSIALLQHFTKGDQSQKDSQDRFSGTSIWNRFPDSLMTFTELEDNQNCFGCEFTLRSFEPIEPFSVRWQFPRFLIDEKLDPQNIKKKAGRKKESSAEQLCSILTLEESIAYTDFERRALQVLNLKSASFERRLREAKAARLIYQSPIDKTYALTPEYCKNNGQ